MDFVKKEIRKVKLVHDMFCDNIVLFVIYWLNRFIVNGIVG